MRICFFADGRSVHTTRWIKYFISEGHEMHLISYAEVSSDTAKQLRDLGIKFHGTISSLHVKKFWRTLKDLRFLKSVLRNEKIDLLHCHFLGLNTWFAALSTYHPYIVTVMGGDVVGDDWPARNIQESKLTPMALRNADVVTAWSRALADRVRPFVNAKRPIEIIHGGIELEKFSPGVAPVAMRQDLDVPSDARVVFSPRLIRRLYNIHTIAHAAGIVCDSSPNTVFLMTLPVHILDEEYVEEIKQIFSKNSAADRVRFLPTIPHCKIADYYRLADVTVSIPSTDGTPMAVLESMACRTATVIGNLRDYDLEYFEHDKTTVMVDVEDPSSVAKGILRLFHEEDLQKSIVNEAERRVRATGGYEFQMSKMEAIYKELSDKP